jgi:hypothetical protein
MGHYARGEIWIPVEDWYEFALKYMPKSDGEWSLGHPIFRDGEMCVPFAINTECHPSKESEPPEWTKGKEKQP